MWWRWLQHPTELWAQIWKQKYAPNIQVDQLIRFNDHIQGSNIWNTAWKNHPLIQRHAFWEVRNGESALFWQDSWQQLTPLSNLEDLNPLRQKLHPNIFQESQRSLECESQEQALETMENREIGITAHRGHGSPSLASMRLSTGRYQSKMAQTFYDGDTLPQVFFRLKKPTTCRGTTKTRTQRSSGARFGWNPLAQSFNFSMAHSSKPYPYLG
jgi:hypothetical protein